MDSKPLMTDGGDIPYGMDGEENVGGVNNRVLVRKNTLLVPLIKEHDDESNSPTKE